MSVVDLGAGIQQIDVYYQGLPERMALYLVRGEKTALVETGPAPGTSHILKALPELGLAPEQVDYIILTHIHLDHAGGAGVLTEHLPRAKVLVHPRGLRHLADPVRLVSGARAVYGERFDALLGEVRPVPADRLYALSDGETLDLGGGRVFTFYHTPGHARHHMIVHDPFSGGIFAGDALGLRLPDLSRATGYDFVLPSTTPSEFDPLAAEATFDRASRLNARYIFFAHFGRAGNVPAILARNRDLVTAQTIIGRRVLASGGSVRNLEESLSELFLPELLLHGIDREHPLFRGLAAELKLNALGIVHYLQREGKN
ncbi:MBL fold metallo-hydrolase [Desulfotomaculum copahuensis]|uniref:Metallo-beta-lactamase domain-containing protein n=1 Tax=Desulfotomaculum copahuensis TaxID=1838280 RepID=A0A1B7LAL9_9FIRM|nr:MBL fold metallo-hydrolase [Desulfotomaculum copahuensis]OAT79375.1 hypothetical protein A6M21_16090 [Desulfotomaculum copahuensis]